MERRRVRQVVVTIAMALALTVLWVPAEAAKLAKPANDDFKRATNITSLPFTDSIDTSRATSSKDDPGDCGSTSNSVWYVLTAPRDMTVAMNTIENSSYFTNVAVYTGTRGSLTQVACATNGLLFEASEGETYHVMVASAFGGGGSLVLNVLGHVPPPNDDFDNATVIPDLPFTETLDTLLATSAPDDPTKSRVRPLLCLVCIDPLHRHHHRGQHGCE